VGDWHGQLDVQGMKLRISFHVSKTGDKYLSTMDSPDQGAMGLPTTSTILTDNILTINIQNMGAEFSGKLDGNKIVGFFKQAGKQLTLELDRKEIAIEKKAPRPQDPVKPYPYDTEDIYFINEKANGIKLAGTLSVPRNTKNPAVAILISGSGPQNRDEEIGIINHRPFLVWSDYLTRNGIAILRYDDRGVAESEGSREMATSHDYSTDAEAAVNYLKTRTDVIDTQKIGLIGHSEGGLIAPMVAARNKDVAFIVLLAAPGIDGADVLLTQEMRSLELANESHEDSKKIEFANKTSRTIFNMIRKEKDVEKLAQNITTYFKKIKKEALDITQEGLTDEIIAQQVKKLTSAWLSYFIRTDPADFIKNVSCPVLAINGSLDFQVVPKLNLHTIKKIIM
jgi:pimeloyl-ACP methyl ester carboxylesterase